MTSAIKRTKSIDLDDVLEQIGSCGCYQRRTLALLLMPALLAGLYNTQYVFAAADMEYRCEVPECEGPGSDYDAGVAEGWQAWALTGTGRCHRRKPTSPSTCSAAGFYNTTIHCTAWRYPNNNSIVAEVSKKGEFNLACHEWKRTLVGTVHSAGLFMAMCLSGLLSDTFGRRGAFILTAAARAVVGFARAFSTGYVMYLVLEFLDAAIGCGVYATAFVMGIEMVGFERRVLMGNTMSSTFASGQMLLALTSWLLPYWRILTAVIYMPSILFITYLCFLDESVRWLMSKGKKKRAVAIIFRMANVNKRELTPDTTSQLEAMAADAPVPVASVTHATHSKSVISRVLHSHTILSRVAVCAYAWLTTTFVYYGLSINSVNLAGNKHVNFALTALVELPGYLSSMLALNRFGRKSCLISGYTLCGVAQIILPFITNLGCQIALSLGAKMFISMVFSSLYIFTLELFPTEARHSLMAACSMMGRCGSLAAPLSPMLRELCWWAPYAAFGGMSLMAALLLQLAPETNGMRLPDTVRQAEMMALAPRRR